MRLDFAFDTGKLSELREAVFAAAAGAGLARDRAADVVLAVHELAANAVLHGAGRGLLSMRTRDGQLHCQVSDTGPARIDGTATRTTTAAQPWPVLPGHGLWLVREAADQVSMGSGPIGCWVAVVFTLPGTASPSPTLELDD